MRTKRVQTALALVLALGAASWGLAGESPAKPKQAGKAKPAEGARYDVLYQIYVPTFADLIVRAIEEAAERDWNRKHPGESDEDFALRKQVGVDMFKGFARAVKETEQFALGWKLDRKEKRTYIDINIAALKDTSLAKQFGQLSELKTSFGGFQLPGAALRANWVGQVPPEQATQGAKLVDVIRARLIKQIEGSPSSDDDKKKLKDLTGEFFDAVRTTAASGRSNGALSVVVRPRATTLVAGGYVADAEKIQNVVKTVGGYLQQMHPMFANLKLDAEKSDSVTFHTMSIPAPQGDDREKFVRVFGESLDVVLGFGKEAVYLAAGKDAMKSLQEAIKKSAAPAVPAAPVEVSVALAPIANFVLAIGNEHQKGPAQTVKNVLQTAKGKDHVRLVVRPRDRGLIIRLEAEEGILNLITTIKPETKEFLLGK